MALTKNTIIPVLRQMLSGMVANSIVGVQPMTGNSGTTFSMKIEKTLGPKYYLEASWKQGDTEYHLVNVSSQVEEWIVSQPQHMWEREDNEHSNDAFKKMYTINNDLMTWMTLAWG
jgi:hypothetical protein